MRLIVCLMGMAFVAVIALIGTYTLVVGVRDGLLRQRISSRLHRRLGQETMRRGFSRVLWRRNSRFVVTATRSVPSRIAPCGHACGVRRGGYHPDPVVLRLEDRRHGRGASFWAASPRSRLRRRQ